MQEDNAHKNVPTWKKGGKQRGMKGRLVTSLLFFLLLLVGLVACGSTTTPTASVSNSTSTSASTSAGPASTTVVPSPAPSGTINPVSTAAASGTVTSGTTANNLAVATLSPVSSAIPTATTTTATSSVGSTTALTPTGNLETDIRRVVDAIKPGVVLIAVTTPQAQGVGTGSIITSDGFILTNFHVVAADGASVSAQTQIQVVLTNGQKYPAKVVGTARGNDLAVIKIEATGLSPIKQGSSGALHVGDWVVAVGNALALPGGPTVTSGIVSAVGRSIQEPPPAGAELTDLVQTSAAINPGNSGGPLLNLSGELVGINTAAPVDPQSQSAAQGIGFAISIDQAKPIIQTLMNGQSVVSPYMGIVPQTLTAGLAAQFSLPTDSGVLIRQVGPGTPAAKAGWKAGEVLTELDGTKLSSVADLQTVLNRHKPGDMVQGTLITPQGQTQQTSLTFGQPPTQ